MEPLSRNVGVKHQYVIVTDMVAEFTRVVHFRVKNVNVKIYPPGPTDEVKSIVKQNSQRLVTE